MVHRQSTRYPESKSSLKSIGITVLLLGTIIALSTSQTVPNAQGMAVPGSWSLKTPRPGPGQEGLGAASVGTTVYAMGGNKELIRNDAYNTLTDTWSVKTSLPTGRVEPAGVIAVGGLVYVISGGCRGTTCNDENTNTKAVEAYNPVTNTWSPKAPIPTARSRSGVAAISGKIYVIGGYELFPLGGPQPALPVVEAYDIATNTWSTLAPMPTAREGLLATALGGQIYAIGGLTTPRITSTPTGAVEVYNPATNTWSTGIASMPTPRGIVMGGVLCGDTIFVMGGVDGPEARGTNEAFFPGADPGSNPWTSHPGLPLARGEGGAAVVGNTIYVVGGFTQPEVESSDTNANQAYTVACSSATVPVLAQFRAPVAGNGRGIAIIGSEIFYTLYRNSAGTTDTNIYVTDLSGNLQRTVNTGVTLGAIHWDGAQLWGGAYDGTGRVFTIDPVTGATTLKFSYNFPATDNCFGQPPNYIDGLAVATGTLWISDDGASVIRHTDFAGNDLGSIALSGMCDTGIGFDGDNLWLMLYSGPFPSEATAWDAVIQQRSVSGAFLWGFRTDGRPYEGVVYDPVSFAPNCAVWGITANDYRVSPTITAFRVPCTTPTPPTHDVAILGVGTMTPEVTQGTAVEVDVWALNNATSTEMFNVNAYVGASQIGSMPVNLAGGQTAFLTFQYTASTPGTFSLSASASTVPGEIDISNNQLTSGSLTVIGPIDFLLAASGAITTTQGGSGSNIITVTLLSGTSQSVILGCTDGLPSGASCSFNPASGSPSFSSTLTIITSPTTPTDLFSINVTGAGGGLTRTVQFTLTVNPPPPVVGGTMVPVDKLALLAPIIGLASLLVAATTVTIVYVRHATHRLAKR